MAIDDKKKPLLTSALDFEGVEGYGGDVDDWFESDLPLSSLSQKPNVLTPAASPINTRVDSAPTRNPVGEAFAAAALAREQARQAADAKQSSAPASPIPAPKVNATPKSSMIAVKEIPKTKLPTKRVAASTKKPDIKSPRSSSKSPSRWQLWLANDNFSVYVGVAVILALLMSFWGSYVYWVKTHANKSGLSYVTLPASAYSLKGRNFRIQVTIQGLATDKDWLQDNKKILNSAFTLGITKVDPDALASPEQMQVVQETLKTEMNKIIPGGHVQAVLLSELLVQNTGE